MTEPLVEPSKAAPAGKEPLKEPVKEPVKEPIKEPVKEPGKEPGKDLLKEPLKEPVKEPVVDPLAVKLEGDKVPDKFKGKTFEEALALMGTTDADLTKTKQENEQWRIYYKAKQAEEAAKAGKPEEKVFNPMDHLDEKQAQSILTLIDARNKPILDGLSGMLLEYTKSIRPDFKQFEPRIKQIYDSLLPEYKFNPEYGWDFSYRFAKAEAEGTPAPPTPTPAVPGPSGTGDTTKVEEPLTEDQKLWAKRMDIPEDEYKKYAVPLDAAKIEEEGRK